MTVTATGKGRTCAISCWSAAAIWLAEYLLALEHNPCYGFHVDGYLAPYANPDLDVRYLGGYDKMEVTLDEPGIDGGGGGPGWPPRCTC